MAGLEERRRPLEYLLQEAESGILQVVLITVPRQSRRQVSWLDERSRGDLLNTSSRRQRPAYFRWLVLIN